MRILPLSIITVMAFLLACSAALADDTSPPTISEIGVNTTFIAINSSSAFNATVTDDVNVSEVRFGIQTPYGNINLTTFNDTASHFYVICNQTNECKTNMSGQYNLTSVWANDTSGNNTTDENPYRNFMSYALGNINVSLDWPSSILNVQQNRTFEMNASVSCSSTETFAFCGIVNGTSRYNLTSENPFEKINTTTGDNPFFTLSENPKTCGTMNSTTQACKLRWTVNASGNVGSSWKIDANFTSDISGIQSNATSSQTINIMGCSVDVTLWFDSIFFGNETDPLLPGSHGNAAVNNSIEYYNITANDGSCVLDIYTKATEMYSSDMSYSIGAGNMTFNNQSNDYSSSKRYSTDYQIMFPFVIPASTLTSWFWLDVPPVYFGAYNGTVYITSVNQSENP